MSKKMPWAKWFFDDWLSDEKLALCSLAAQGLWMRLLAIMHKSHRRGFLSQANGKPYSQEQIARACGCSAEEAAHLTQELITTGAAYVDEHGVIFNMRMVREEQLRKVRSAAGRKGGNATWDLLKQNQDLLKQNLKQNSSKTLAYGILEGVSGGLGEEGETRPPPDFELTAHGLAQAWCFYYRGTAGTERNEYAIAETIAEWLRIGIKPKAIHVAILDKSRDRTEATWMLKDRIFSRKNGKAVDPPPPLETPEQVSDRRAKAKAERENRCTEPVRPKGTTS